MSVFVDNARLPYGRYLMCHMWADSVDELFAMVDHIRVDRCWFQRPPKASWEHFDITQTKRALAVHAGAIETDRYGPAEHVAKLRGDQTMLDRIARLRARKVN